VSDLFTYKNGYSFAGLSEMAERFSGLRLPFLRDLNAKDLLSEYIFGISMKRFPVGPKNTLRRFLGGLFEPRIECSGDGASAFVFTGDGAGRPDYRLAFEKVAGQCGDASMFMLDRRALRFKPWRLCGVIPELVWAFRIDRIVKRFFVSFDMAVSLFRACTVGESLLRRIRARGAERATVFCDAWSIENYIVQKLKQSGVATATLQHGNGTDIFLGSCSDRYLANSRLSEKNAVRCGIGEDRLVVVGPMKYAGESFAAAAVAAPRCIGVVFDGADNFDNNAEMLDVIHEALAELPIRCLIRFHPNNRREDYAPFLNEADEAADSLEAFESAIDLCVVYNSTMYTDMIYKHIPVVRFKNGKTDLYPDLADKGFSSATELRGVLTQMRSEPESFRQSQELLYKQVFGASCGPDSYRDFYRDWGR